MASLTPPLQRDAERRFVESLRARYEDEGFTFTPHPGRDRLPPFLGTYMPDALAQKPGQNIVIEVKSRANLSVERSLTSIKRLLDGHADWQFRVVIMGTDPHRSATISTPEPETIRDRLNELRTLVADGHRRSAFVMSWPLLEAALRSRDDAANDRFFTPGTVVQTLAMKGFIEPETERNVRALIDLRNHIVHGDLLADPSAADVGRVLSAIEEALATGFRGRAEPSTPDPE